MPSGYYPRPVPTHCFACGNRNVTRHCDDVKSFCYWVKCPVCNGVSTWTTDTYELWDGNPVVSFKKAFYRLGSGPTTPEPALCQKMMLTGYDSDTLMPARNTRTCATRIRGTVTAPDAFWCVHG